MESDLISRIDALFAPWDRRDSPGCAIGIIQNRVLIHARGFGRANLEHDIAITSGTVFDIASTSKQFTAACIALLAEAGQLQLDDDVRRTIPELPDFGRPVTIRHLIHHTSGWRDYLTLFDLAGYREADYADDTEVVGILARQQGLNFPPGERYDYSNTGYYLLGVIVERVSGQSLATFAHDHIFAPLGMTHTWFQDDHTRIVPNRATGYSLADTGGYRVDMTMLDMVGDGALLTSVEDLSLWDANFYDNQLGAGSQALIDQMTTPGRLNSGALVPYGFGLDLVPYRDVPCTSHSGWFVGYRSAMMRFPTEEVTIICLANSSAINPTALCAQAADLWLEDAFENAWELADKGDDSGKPVSEPTHQIAVGFYYDDKTRRVIEICSRSDQLAADFGTGPRPLTQIAQAQWRTTDGPYDVYADDPTRLRVTLYGRPHAEFALIPAHLPTHAELTRLSGSYDNPELEATYVLTWDGHQLWAKVGRTAPAQLQPAGTGIMRLDDRTLTFETGEDGSVSGFTLSADRAWGFRFARRPAG